MTTAIRKPWFPLIPWFILWALPVVSFADFEPALARLVLDYGSVHAGGTLQATYTFRSSGPAMKDLMVFIHVVRSDGRFIGADFEPALPTTQWPAKGFVREGPMPIALPADAAPGKYQVWVGMFTPGGDRVQLDNADRLRGQREYLAGEFEVVPPATATGAKEARFDLLPVEEGALVRAPTRAAREAIVIADAGAKTFSVTDFGAKPDDGQDDTAAIRATIAAAAGHAAGTILFPRGQYDVRDAAGAAAWERMITAAVPGKESWRGNPPQGLEGSPQEKNTVFRLNGCRGLTIDGQGSNLMIHGLNQTLLIEDCQGMVVRNLKIDHDPPTAMTGKVLAVAERRIDVEILDTCPRGGEPFIALQTYDPVTRLATGQETFAGVQSTELLRAGVLRLNMTGDGRGNFSPPVGHLLAMRHILVGYEPVEIKHSSGVLLEDVDIYAGAGMGIVGVGTENLTLSRVRVMPRPGASRLVSTTADATHFINCSGTVTLEGCHFEGMGDDHLNVHGQYEFVHRRLDARTLEARIGTLAGFGQWPEAWVWGWATVPKSGDPLEFFRLPSLEVTAKAQVESIQYDRKTGRSRIVLIDPLPDSVKEGDQFQDARQIPALRVRNCYFGPNRARGTLITTRDAIVEGCTFDRTGGSPVFICCEVDWLEAPAPSSVVIRNNRFLGCGYAIANEGAAITAVFKQGGAVGGWMRNLTIEGNLIKGYPGAGVLAAQVDGLVFRNNRLEATRPSMTLRGCRNGHSEGNQQDGGKPEIQTDSSCEASTLDLPDAR